MNRKTHKIYTDKLSISVVDLTRIDLATEEDLRYEIDKWAKLFKATTWEDLKMITATNSVLAEAGAAIYEISEEEHLRQQLEAREDALRTERDVQKQFERVEKERDAAIAERDAAVAKLDATTTKLDAAMALLKKHGIDPEERE